MLRCEGGHGDAIVCLWTVAKLSLRLLALKASQCVLGYQYYSSATTSIMQLRLKTLELLYGLLVYLPRHLDNILEGSYYSVSMLENRYSYRQREEE